jgi:hypothetical protein
LNGARPSPRLWQRIAWFAALWSGGVLLTFSVAQLLRWLFARILR